MKRFLAFLISAATLVAGGCSDSGVEEDVPVPPAPVLTMGTGTESVITIQPEGGEGRITYKLENPVEGQEVSATSDLPWVHGFDCSKSGTITFVVDANDTSSSRMAAVTVSYPGADSFEVSIIQPKGFLFEVEMESGCSHVSLTVTPSDDDTPYIGILMKVDEFNDEYRSDEVFLESEIAYFKEIAKAYNLSLAEVIQEMAMFGPNDGISEGLDPETDYYLLLYAISTQGEILTPLTKLSFRTTAFEGTFTIKCDPMDISCQLEVIPTNEYCLYYYDVLTKAAYEAMAGNFTEMLTEELMNMVKRLQDQGYDVVFSDLLANGADGYLYSGLEPETDYVAFAQAYTQDGKALGELVVQEFRTLKFEATDNCTFDISFPTESVSATTFDVQVVPSKNTTRYYVGACPSSAVEGATPDEIAAAWIQRENSYGMDWAGDEYIYTSECRLNTYRDMMLSPFSPREECTVVVFGINESGMRTTEVALAKVTTTTESLLTDLSMTVRDITADGAFIDIVPSNEEEIYFIDVFPTEVVNQFASDAELIEGIIAAYDWALVYALMQGTQVLDCNTYLDPSTEYVAVAFGCDGVQATTKLFKSEPFTTKSGSRSVVGKSLAGHPNQGLVMQNRIGSLRSKTALRSIAPLRLPEVMAERPVAMLRLSSVLPAEKLTAKRDLTETKSLQLRRR